jgi:hypothetical protein
MNWNAMLYNASRKGHKEICGLAREWGAIG